MRGRGARRGESGWRELLGKYPGSGLTVEGFCRREGIAVASFYRWQKLLETGSDSDKPAQCVSLATRGVPGFVDLGSVGVGSSRVEMHLDLGNGIRVQLVRS
jgi:hypothetical protein